MPTKWQKWRKKKPIIASVDYTSNNKLSDEKASKIQALFRGVKFRSKELPNIIEEDLKRKKLIEIQQNQELQRQANKAIQEKYNDLYKPSSNLHITRRPKNPNATQLKQKKLQRELNKDLEHNRRKKLASEHLMKYPLN